MMAGVHLGGKYLRSKAYVDYFLLSEDWRYNCVYTHDYYYFDRGVKETCDPSGMYHAAPVILAFWSE